MKKIVSKILLLILLTSYANCTKNFDELKIGTNTWPGYEPLHLANHQNKFKDLPIHLIEFLSTSQVIRFFRNKSINAAALTVDESIYLKNYGIEPKLILIMDISNGADILISKNSIKTISELKGKKIGVENNALGAYFLSRILNIHNIKIEEVNIIPLEIQLHIDSFKTNEIDALITFSIFEEELINNGGNKLFDSSMIPGEITDVLIVDSNYYSKNKKVLKHLLKIWFEAIEKENLFKKESLYFMSKRLEITNSSLINSLNRLNIPDIKENYDLMKNENSPFLNSWKMLNQQMINSKLIPKEIPFNNIIEPELIIEILHESN
jgi:NitT/TauT family transport system substrate-binding protein